MISWPDRLIHDIARRKCVALLGSGVSYQSTAPDGARPPLWKKFLDDATELCPGPCTEIKRYIKKNDFLTACQLIKAKMGDHDWHDLLERTFQAPNYAPAEIHQTIFSLDLPIVATTNIDRIYDKFITSNYNGSALLKSYHDDSLGRYIRGDSSTRLVIKVHGTVDSLDKTVFTKEEYAEARNNYAQFYTALSALIITQTFLFIGYSLADPDMQILLEDNARLFKSPMPHYLLTADKASQDIKQMYERNFGIKILQYSDKDNHSELTASLSNLSDLVSTERSNLAEKQIW